MNRRYDWRLGKVRSVDTGGQVIYDTALSRFRLADDGEGTPYDPLLGVRVGTLLNQIPVEYTDYLARVAADGGTVYNGSDGTTEYLLNQVKALKDSGMYADASLVLFPSAVKTGKLYSVKGSDFSFTRNLQKWVVNASNILYSSGANLPALRWDVTREKWEFDKENAASTLITQSLAQDSLLYSMLKLTRGTNTDDSPFGSGTADRGTEDTTSGSHLYYGGWTRVAGNKYTISLIIKLSGRTKVKILYSGDTGCAALYELENLTAVTEGVMESSAGIESYGDDYRRIWLTFTAASDALGGQNSTNLNLHNGTTTAYLGDGASHIIRAHHNLVIGDVSSPIVAGASNVTRPEDVATATAVINTANPYSFVYNIAGNVYIDIFKEGNKTTYKDGVFVGTVVQAPSTDITLSAVGRYGRFLCYPREILEGEMAFFLSNNVGIDTETVSIDNANTSIDLT